MDEIKDMLIKIGLSEKEAIIYISILRVWTATLTEISENSWIKRTTLYGYLDILINKWFIIKTIKSKRALYKATNPESILKDLRKKSDFFLTSLPKLLQIYESSTSKPTFVVYEQIAGIKSIYKEIRESFHNIYAVFSPKNFTENIPYKDRMELLEWIRKNQNKIYNLSEDNFEWRRFAKEFAKNEMKLKFLPKDLEISVDILIYGDKIAFISFKNLNWIVISNKEIASCLRWLHKMIWKGKF